jgi:uncharacterized protein
MMQRIRILVCSLLLGGVAPLPAVAAGPAMDCQRARGAVETLICNDAKLAHLDATMNRVYRQSLHVANGLDALPDVAVRELKATQRGWVKGRDGCWKAPDVRRCVVEEYERRISELQVKWQLVGAQGSDRFECADGTDFTLTWYPTAQRPAVNIEYERRHEIYVAEHADGAKRYDGLFGHSVTLGGKDAVFVPDAAHPEIHCTRKVKGAGGSHAPASRPPGSSP